MNDDRQSPAGSRSIGLELVAGLSAVLDVSQWGLIHAPVGRQIICVGEVIDLLPLLVSGEVNAVIRTAAPPHCS